MLDYREYPENLAFPAIRHAKLGAPHSPPQTAVLQTRPYRARSKSGKQVRQGAAWMTACETLLLETGSVPAFPFL